MVRVPLLDEMVYVGVMVVVIGPYTVGEEVVYFTEVIPNKSIR